MQILLTGAQGQLGRSLQQLHPPHWQVTALGSAQLDISDEQAVRRQVRALRPAVIINAAAYNAVDRAQTERERAFAVNAWGPRILAQAANDVGARLVHVSTDYVFDGTATQPYDEQANTNPLNVYGESKLQGEQWVLQVQPQALVLRTAWVYSALSANFVTAMLRASQNGRLLRIVDDQTGAPTYAGDLAQAISVLAEQTEVHGIYHCSGATALTRYDFVRAIFSIADAITQGERMGLLTPIPSSEYPSVAVRPKYSVLDCGKLAALGLTPRPLQESLSQVIGAWLASPY